MTRAIPTEAWSAQYRPKVVDVPARRLLITNFQGSQQAADLSEPPNCGGFGRIRHFRRATSPGWPANPLPIDPALHALQLPPQDTLRAQVFQNAACNWRCWYCYVPFDLLAANPGHSSWLTADELLDLYLAEPVRPAMIDLTGGQPDLTPEWIPWMMEALRKRGLERSVYLWSDDNLSTDYYTRMLSKADRVLMREFPMYGRVCCFKGYDQDSFAYNTLAAKEL